MHLKKDENQDIKLIARQIAGDLLPHLYALSDKRVGTQARIITQLAAHKHASVMHSSGKDDVATADTLWKPFSMILSTALGYERWSREQKRYRAMWLTELKAKIIAIRMELDTTQKSGAQTSIFSSDTPTQVAMHRTLQSRLMQVYSR